MQGKAGAFIETDGVIRPEKKPQTQKAASNKKEQKIGGENVPEK